MFYSREICFKRKGLTTSAIGTGRTGSIGLQEQNRTWVVKKIPPPACRVLCLNFDLPSNKHNI
jgi:hypothetical protein